MIFKQGDIVKVNLNPAKGHEQGNYRPALVINRDDIFLPGGINIILPITTHNGTYKKQFALEVELDNSTLTKGYVLCFQPRTLDLNARNAIFVERAPKCIIEQCCDYASQILNAMY